MSKNQKTLEFFNADLECRECGAQGMQQIQGGGGLMVWECPSCRAEQTFVHEGDGGWVRREPTSDDDKFDGEHPLEGTIAGLMEGLSILRLYMSYPKAGNDRIHTRDILTAEHGMVHFFVDLEDLPEDSHDGKALVALGFVPTEADNWGWPT